MEVDNMDVDSALHAGDAAKRFRASPERGRDVDEDLSTTCSAIPPSITASTVGRSFPSTVPGEHQDRSSLAALVPIERPRSLASWLRWWLPWCSGARLSEPPDQSILGEGAFARVIRARSASGDCAVKQLERGRPDIVRRECDIARRIAEVQQPHPCIAQVFFVVPAERGSAAVVMELCEGPSLYTWIKERKGRSRRRGTRYEPSEEAPRWFAQIFLAMEFLHRRLDIVHRDLKPENVVLHNHHVAKLVDYGVGRHGLESDGHYSLGGPPGTLGYKAPELLAGKPYDYRVDFYSLGVLLWVLQTGGVLDEHDSTGLTPPRGGVMDPHEQLMEHLKTPAEYGLPALPTDVKRMVKKLTRWSDADDRSFERRGTHDGVRGYAFLAQLNMPAWSSSAEEVKIWLARRPRTSRLTCCFMGET